MTTYAPTHARALAQVTRRGTAVSFVQTIPGTNDPLTGRYTGPSSTTVSGYAVRARGNPKLYELLKLIEADAPTLFFTPSTFGSLPELGSACSWGGVSYTVKHVGPVAPDGTVIAARIVVAR